MENEGEKIKEMNRKKYVSPQMIFMPITKENICMVEELYKMGDLSRMVVDRIRLEVYGDPLLWYEIVL